AAQAGRLTHARPRSPARPSLILRANGRAEGKMRRVIILVAVVVVAIGLYLWLKPSGPSAEPHVADAATVRTTHQGEVIGFTTRRGAHAWLGLPYAQPPVDALRWRAPLPAAAWTGRREALAISNVCMQYPSMISGVRQQGPSDAPIGSEDCLYLNIY